MISIGSTSATAVKSCKAVLACLLRIYIAKLELIADIRIYNTGINISKQEFFISHKLMTGVEISPWRYSQVFGS